MSRTGTENKKNETTLLSDKTKVNPLKYAHDRKIYDKVKKELELRERLRKTMSTYNINNTGYLPGSTISASTITASTITSTSAITINGDPTYGSMKVDVPLIVNGRDVMKELDEMRDALLLLKRDVDMEKKYPRLKELKDQYEAELAKYKTFDILKESK